MPKVTIWIKNADYDKWKAIDNVPEWLHEHLNMPKFSKMQLSPRPVPQLTDKEKAEAKTGFIIGPNPSDERDESIKEMLSDEPTVTPPEEAL